MKGRDRKKESKKKKGAGKESTLVTGPAQGPVTTLLAKKLKA